VDGVVALYEPDAVLAPPGRRGGDPAGAGGCWKIEDPGMAIDE